MQAASALSPVDVPDTTQQKTSHEVDTTRGSLLHFLAARLSYDYDTGLTSVLFTAMIGVGLTYVPLMASVLLGSSSSKRSNSSSFLHDWNTVFTFLVSLPLLLTMLLRDNRILVSSLRRVRGDGVLIISDEAFTTLCSTWQSKFWKINLAAQACGGFVGLLMTWLMYNSYAGGSAWMSSTRGLLQPVGAVFLWCIFFFYGMIPVYALRCVATSFFLADVV